MIRITLLLATACSVVVALPMQSSHGVALGLPISFNHGVVSALPITGVVSRQPFRVNRLIDPTLKMEASPRSASPQDAHIPGMRSQVYPPAPARNEDDSVEKEAKLNFAKVLNDIKHLPMPQEAQSGEEYDSVENDSIKKDAGLRSVGVRFETAKRLEAETSAAPAKPTEAVLEGEAEEEDSNANGVEGQDEQMCVISLEMLEDLPFEEFIPVAKHVDEHGHVNGVAGEVIIGEAIIPVAGAIGVVPCKELQKKLQQIHHHESVDRQWPIMK